MTHSAAAPNAVLPLAGRILIASLFGVFGVRDILYFSGFSGYLAKLGFPASDVMTAIAMVLQLVAAAMLIVGWKTRWAAWALIAFTAIATFAAHRFWEVDAAQYVPQLTNFLKNLAIAGGLLAFAAYGPGPLSVDKE